MQAASRVIVCFSSVIFFCFFFLLFFFVCFHSLLVLILPRPGCSISRAVTFPTGPPESIGDMGAPPRFHRVSIFFTIFDSRFFFKFVPTQYLDLPTPLLLAAIAVAAASPSPAFLFLSNYMQKPRVYILFLLTLLI